MRAAAALLILTLAAGAGPAAAQPPAPYADPIAALLLDHRGDADEPDTAGQTVAPPEADPTLQGLPPARPPSAAPRRPRLTAPVQLEETGKTADAPPSERDIAYDSRLRAAFSAAQGFQGPLEGGWTLAAQGGPDLYALRIVDRRDRLEGVWRDLRRTGAPGASGLVDEMQRSGDDLTLRFTVGDQPPSVIVLHDGGAGRWAGRLTRGDEIFDVLLRRSGP